MLRDGIAVVDVGNMVGRQVGLAAARVRTASVLEIDLEKFVTDYAAASPRTGDAFTLPSEGERATLLQAWQLLRTGDADRAAGLVDGFGMEVARIVDTGAAKGAASLMMFDRGDRSTSRGFGMYLARSEPGADTSFHLQAPHPWDDNHTERIAALAYRDSDAATLAVAGASRRTGAGQDSDAAHSASTLFSGVAESVATPGARIVQLHGFGQARHPEYGSAVVSTGANPDDLAQALRASLRERSFDARLVGVDGAYPNLAGRNNVQGAEARRAGASWVHVELGDRIRATPADRDHIAEAVSDAARRTTPVVPIQE